MFTDAMEGAVSMRRVFEVSGAVALRRSLPRHPDKALSYLPVILNLAVRILALVILINLAITTRGILQAVFILVGALAAPMAALYAAGFVLLFKKRAWVVETVRPSEEQTDLEK